MFWGGFEKIVDTASAQLAPQTQPSVGQPA
jgi:hypothetical protein